MITLPDCAPDSRPCRAAAATHKAADRLYCPRRFRRFLHHLTPGAQCLPLQQLRIASCRQLRGQNGRTIKCTDAGRILIGCRRRGKRVRIEVWDTGRGIPEEQQRQIFWEFVRLELRFPRRDLIGHQPCEAKRTAQSQGRRGSKACRHSAPDVDRAHRIQMVVKGGCQSTCIVGRRLPADQISGNERPCRDAGVGEIALGLAMLKRANRASHIDPPASSNAIMRRARPYCGENPEPGKDVTESLTPQRPELENDQDPQRTSRQGVGPSNC
jgi:hypothetical protein